MDETLIKTIKEIFPSPLITVIGATNPDESYNRNDGMMTGYLLRNLVENKGGTIFTGGVPGVGVDVYTGIIRYGIDKALKTGILPDDSFFVLVPNFIDIYPKFISGNLIQNLIPQKNVYTVPQEYTALSYLTSKKEMEIVRAGNNMEERRDYLASIADILITINGGFGTLDEAYSALKLSKEVICLPFTGGAAEILTDISLGKKTRELSEEGLDFEKIDKSKIKTINSLNELIRYIQLS